MYYIGMGIGEDKRDLTKDREAFIKAVTNILEKEIQDLPIPHKKFKETKKILSEMIKEEKIHSSEANFVLPTSKSEFLKTLSKYLPKSESKLCDPYLRKFQTSDPFDIYYLTPSGNTIKFEYK